jgi:hypothetical protein
MDLNLAVPNGTCGEGHSAFQQYTATVAHSDDDYGRPLMTQFCFIPQSRCVPARAWVYMCAGSVL